MPYTFFLDINETSWESLYIFQIKKYVSKKSLAYSLTYQDKNETLVEDKVNQAFDRVTAKLIEEFDITVR